MEDVRVYTGVDAGSYHELMIASLNVRVAKAPVTVQQRTKRFDTSRLSSPDHCPAKQIPNIIRPGRALYICQVGTDTNIIPCNMWREPSIQEQTYMSWLSQDTIAKIEERKTIKSRLLQTKTKAQKQAARRNTKNNRRKLDEAPIKTKEAI